MNRFFVITIITTLLPISVSNAEITLNSELTRCAAISRDLQRLACYDTLSGKATASPAEALSTKSRVSLAGTASANNTIQPSTTTSVETTASTQPKNTFGLDQKGDEPDSLSSYIPGEFSGWKNGDKITLANGQVWKIIDSKGTIHHKASNPKVTISKGVFSSYRIKIEGMNKSFHVKRIK